jgi:hypothetical protein
MKKLGIGTTHVGVKMPVVDTWRKTGGIMISPIPL